MSGHLARVFATLLLGVILSGALVRLAPGYGADERQLDVRLSAESIQALQEQRRREGDLGAYYVRFVTGYFKGDLGMSALLNLPVRQLIAERFGPTLTAVTVGLALAWTGAAGVAAGAYFSPWMARWILAWALGLFLSIPVAALAFVFVSHGGGSTAAAGWVVGCAVFPKVAQYLHRLFSRARSAPHVLTAHARGLGRGTVFWRHVACPCLPEISALAGVSLTFALSAAIPAEVVLDVAGLGQLAWQAALGRDLNLLVQLTLLISAVIVVANALAEWPAVKRRTAA